MSDPEPHYIAQVEQRFAGRWRQEDLQRLVTNSCVDDAWTLLSNVAELSLARKIRPRNMRSNEPQIHTRDLGRKASTTSESVELRRLRRLHRRLSHRHQQASGNPAATLVQNILRESRELAHTFPQLHHFQVDEPTWANQIQTLVEETAAFELSQRLDCWKVNITNSPLLQRSWVKKRAEVLGRGEATPTAARNTTLSNALHPSHVLNKAVSNWQRVWRRGAVNQQLYQNLLQQVRQPSAAVAQVCDLCPSSTELRSTAKSMIGKAAGADAWQAEDLLRLPETWWQNFATLRALTLQLGRPPTQWKNALLVLIDKAEPGDTRPLGLSPVVWRVGAKWTLRQILPNGWTTQC